MEQSTARILVRIVAVFNFIGAALLALLALILLIASPMMGDMAELGGATGVVVGVLAVVFLLIAAVAVLIGWGLWAQKNWARITTIVFAALGVLVNIMALVSGDIISSSLGIIFDGIIIWLFAFQPEVVALFTSAAPKAAPAVTAKPAAKKKKRR